MTKMIENGTSVIVTSHAMKNHAPVGRLHVIRATEGTLKADIFMGILRGAPEHWTG
jgi:hypothetical protein